ncbi:MAG TPA: hypothetical protein VMX17_14190, partial [Candidatus Glassbacteria bacterium]|nr:hypothetical protein [Candidatus Glassbacteria bacterium]
MSLDIGLAPTQFSAYANNVIDDIKPYPTLVDIQNVTPKYTDVLYKAEDTGNFYKWDGAVLSEFISGTGAVASVIAGANVSVTGLALNPTVNVPISNAGHTILTNTTLQGQLDQADTELGTLGTGSVTNASNEAVLGATVFKDKTGTILNFKTFNVTGLNIANNASDINISTPQSIINTATPLFNEVQVSTSTPSTNAMLTSKLYVDTAIGGIDLTPFMQKASNLSDVVNAQTSLTNITGVADAVKANGALMVGNGTNFTTNTITPTANQVNVVNGAGTITLSLPQNIHTSAQPTFNRITSTLAPNTGLAVTNRDYVLGLDGANVKTITSNQPDLITVGGTVADVTLDLAIAGGVALRYLFDHSNNPAAEHLTVDFPTNFVNTTYIRVRYDAENRHDDDYIKEFFDVQDDAMPFKILLIDHINANDYASFYVTAKNTLGANYIEWACEYDASDSSVATFA